MQRRQFLQNSLILGATLPSLVACLGSDGSSAAPTSSVGGNTSSAREVDALLATNAFPYGVASGDPDTDKLILWTALKPLNADTASMWRGTWCSAASAAISATEWPSACIHRA